MCHPLFFFPLPPSPKFPQNMIAMMRRQEKDRKWRSNLTRIGREVTLLEEDEYQLERIFPQGEDGDVRWVVFMLGFYVLGAMSFVGFCLSLMWIAQIIVYMVPPVPLNPLLNDMFVAMDNVFPLFGTLFFAFFSVYLMVVAMKVRAAAAGRRRTPLRAHAAGPPVTHLI